MKQETTLPSGSKFVADVVPFGIAGELRRTLARELKKVDLNFSDGLVLKLIASKSRNQVLAALAGEDINVVKNLFLELIGSAELENVIFECFTRCLLNGNRIDRNTFEPEGARQDFYPAAVEVVKGTLLPFTGGLLSKLKTPSAEKPDSPAS